MPAKKIHENATVKLPHGKIVQNKPQLLMKSASGDTSTLIYGFYRTKDSYWFNQIIILMTENKKTTLIDIKGLFPIRSLIIGN